jgi:pyruvate kinase
MIGVAEDTLLRDGAIQMGDRIVIVGSSPLTIRGRTNFLKVHTVSGRHEAPMATT